MKVLLVDDNSLMIEGLQHLLKEHDITVAGVAIDGLEAVAQARELRPDVILMDVYLPGCDGLEATRLIKAEIPGTKIVMLTESTDDQDLFEAVKSGACGYLLKSIGGGELVEALKQVKLGIPPFSPGLAEKLLNEFARVSNSAEPFSVKSSEESVKATLGGKLNPRQIEVLRLVSDGLSYKEVGSRLSLSPRTIKYHMAGIMERLHLDNRAQVLAYAGKIAWKYSMANK